MNVGNNNNIHTTSTTSLSDESEHASVPVTSENFELWIKMATDNKINVTNSWNFALIDYFHDFSILKEGDGVNFQKASTTLDGCTKIYSHRIESAFKDTDALLTSLNMRSKMNKNSHNNHGSNNRNQNDDQGDDENNESDNDDHGDDDDDDDNDQGEYGKSSNSSNSQRRKNSKKKKSKKDFTVSFNKIKMKDSDRSMGTDPVFKSALTHFDEGGAKSLLNNFLRISNNSKVIFDIATEADIIIGDEDDEIIHEKLPRRIELDDVKMDDEEEEEEEVVEEQEKAHQRPIENTLPEKHNIQSNQSNNEISHIAEENSIDFDTIKQFVDFDMITQSLDVCPSLKELQNIAEGKEEPGILLEKLQTLETDMAYDNTNPFIANDNDPPDFDFDIDMGDNYNYNNNNNNNNTTTTNNNNNNNDYDANEHNDDDNHPHNDTANISKRTQFSLFMDDPDNPDESNHNITFTHHNFEEMANDYTNPLDAIKPDQLDIELMRMYDDIGSKNYQPRLNWKIERLKRERMNNYNNRHKTSLTEEDDDDDHEKESPNNEIKNTQRRHNRSKKPTNLDDIVINFMSDDEDTPEDELFESTEYMSKMLLSEKERKSGRHLLEPDSLFTVKRLAFLSIKPNQLIRSLLRQNGHHRSHKDREIENIPAHEEFFAEQFERPNEDDDNINNDILNDSILSEDINRVPNFDNDYDPNGVEGFDIPLSDPFTSPTRGIGSDFIQSPNKAGAITYAKRAKKVDVKLLKKNLWNSIEEISIHKKKRSASHFDEDDEENEEPNYDSDLSKVNHDKNNNSEETPHHDDITPTSENTGSDESHLTNKTSTTTLDEIIDEDEGINEMHFKDVVEIMSSKYNGKSKNDLSTSFCFICLLHLANEEGLLLESMNNQEDIIIHK